MTTRKLRTTVVATLIALTSVLAVSCRTAAPNPASSSSHGADQAGADAPVIGKEETVETLQAGPIQLKFKDGELRYLYVGNKEIVRRIFFAVRDGNWQTPMPVFSQCQIEKKPDSFKIALAATCKSDTVDYAWTGEITGGADGQIAFRVTGTPQKDFKSNRIGICVLYGADALVGQEFQTRSADGQTTAGKFPDLVTMNLVAKDYQSLTYTAADGPTVACSLAPILFTMEDQRNYGDSSFKAYNSVLTGPDALKGQAATVTATLRVTGARLTPPAAGPVRIVLSKPLAGLRPPKLLPAAGVPKTGDFLSLDGKRNELKDQPEIAFGFKPSTHLPDDDTFMENRAAIFWQLKTMHALAPTSRIRVALRLTDQPDRRSSDLFAASWAVGALRQLARGHADEASLAMETGPIDSLLEKFQAPETVLLNADVMASGRAPVEVLAWRRNAQTTVLIANSTATAQKIVLEGIPPAVRIAHGPLVSKTSSLAPSAAAPKDTLTADVAPYGIYGVVIDTAGP